MQIRVYSDFDGGNPQDPSSIIHKSEEEVIVHPYSEDQDPAYKFRIDIKLSNDTSKAKEIRLCIDWETNSYMSLRDFLYLHPTHGITWEYIQGTVSGTQSLFLLSLPPGESYACLHPKYSYSDCIGFLNTLGESPYINKRLIGRSGEGREIWAVKISDPSQSNRKTIAIVGRIHPYETAGSYSMEGIIDAYRQPSDAAAALLKEYDLFVIPMANPDGVLNGLCKRTRIGGPDLSKEIDFRDESNVCLKRAMDEVKPSIYIEFHNWMFKDLDGIYFLDAWKSHKFKMRMPSQKEFGKRWKTMLRSKIFMLPATGMKKYCSESFGSTCVCFEYPWFRRSTKNMKDLGIHTILAVQGIM